MGDKNGKKGDEPKPEDKDNNIIGTAGAHIGVTITHQDSNVPGDGSSIGAHVSEVDKPNTRPTRSVQEILATHDINDPIWDHTDACNESIDTVNSADALADSHITERVPGYILRRSKSTEVHIIDTYVSPESKQDDGLYQFMYNYDEWAESTYTFSGNDIGSSNTFTVVDTNYSTNKSIKSDFRISERQS